MDKQQFIEEIAKAAKAHIEDYGICVVSPIIAQACLESAFGTSSKAQYHNYFGLKYRENRVTCNSGYFRAGSQEQKADGSYYPVTDDWYSFDSIDSGVEGYLQFINIPRYENLKGVTDPHEYLTKIKEDGYATSIDYVKNVWRVVEQYDLTQYDSDEEVKEMGYTNSPLIDCTVKSPNHSGTRTHKIDRITPHCVVGQLSAESIGACFPNGRGASCNYGVGYDGRQCLIVDEANRSWCTSSNANDQRAITIEVASDKTAPYAFTNEAYAGLLELCIDICKRNDINKVLWFSDKSTALNYEPKDGECVLTVHRWFANKSCPGDWMYNRMAQLANEINKAIGGTSTSGDVEIKVPNDGKTLYRVQCGAYKVKANADKQLAAIKAKGIDAFITQVDGLYKVQVGAYGVKSNAENQLAKMKSLGFDCFITTVSRESESFIPRKSSEEIAKEIWAGTCSDSRWSTWGNGNTRKERLEAAGYNYDSVQEAIKKLYR